MELEYTYPLRKLEDLYVLELDLDPPRKNPAPPFEREGLYTVLGDASIVLKCAFGGACGLGVTILMQFDI